jgi:dienelactone hydrolase
MNVPPVRNKVAQAALLTALTVLSFSAFQAPIDSEDIVLTKGLAIAFPEGACRSVLPQDPVEFNLVTGQWSPPYPGDILSFTSPTSSSSASSNLTWEAITADEKGWFQNRALRCGYAYFTYDSPNSQVLLLEGFAHDWVYVNGKPRVGNRYGQSETYESWQPRFDFCSLPVRLVPGRNEFLFKCARGRLKVRLSKPPQDVFFNTRDMTLPDLIVGDKTETMAAIVVVNASELPLHNSWLAVSGADLASLETPIPEMRPLSVRKIAFPLRGKAPAEAGDFPIEITLFAKDQDRIVSLDKAEITLRALKVHEAQRRTYVSSVDGSVQHYAVLPARPVQERAGQPAALVLSLHGAGVEALNQVRSYSQKTWAHIVAPTNRRPYGFNWEDWGGKDALEVLTEAQKWYKTDPDRIYLSGHSMGGHGVWSVGGLFPDRFGAIGPSAGWVSFWSYRVRQPLDTQTPIGQMIMRPFLPSDPRSFIENYAQHGIYILHGEKDESVPVSESRQMAASLQKLQKDFVYHEQPGAGHWWDVSSDAGVDCVDWPPMFDFFARHARPGGKRVREIKFTTPCPGISASCNWLTIEAQLEPLKPSSVRIRVSPADGLISGSTENVARLALDLSAWELRKTLGVELDGQKISDIAWPKEESHIWLASREGRWEVRSRPAALLKGPHRYGLFKDAFNNRVVLVFATHSTPEENAWAEAKARYDAETFWYQGNGSLDIIPDRNFAAALYPDRNVILYGHAGMNSAWPTLLGESPVQVGRGRLNIGADIIQDKNLGCLFIRPRSDSDIASVAVVAGTSLAGMRLTNNLPYLYAGYSFPDLFIARPALLTDGFSAIEAAGFFGPDWRVESRDIARNSLAQ